MNRRRFLNKAIGGTATLGVLSSAVQGSEGAATPVQEVPGYDPKPAPAKGPLQVHPENPRYFTDGSGKAIFLTGAHTWANFQDIGLAPFRASTGPPT
jgi:hypothetical protein